MVFRKPSFWVTLQLCSRRGSRSNWALGGPHGVLFIEGHMYFFRFHFNFLFTIIKNMYKIILIELKLWRNCYMAAVEVWVKLTTRFPLISLASRPIYQIWHFRTFKDSLLGTGLRYKRPDSVKITTNWIDAILSRELDKKIIFSTCSKNLPEGKISSIYA